jgi:prephenate dehydrogenase
MKIAIGGIGKNGSSNALPLRSAGERRRVSEIHFQQHKAE